MSYQKPTVTVRQVQVSQSLPLPSPTFESCIVGKGYYWQDPFREDEEVNSIYSSAYVGDEVVVPVSDFTEHTDLVSGSVMVDLIRTKGPGGAIGEVIPLEETTDFTVGSDIDGNGEITISAGIDGFVSADGDEAKIRVGFLSNREDLDGKFAQIVETQDIVDIVGEPEPFNPLAFGASLAMAASGRSTNILGTLSGDFTEAATNLEARDVYVIAALTDSSSEGEAMGAHASEMALPENKKERIVFASRKVPSYEGENSNFSTSATNTEKSTTAESIKTYATGIGNKRYFHIHPDMGWVESEVHISTLRSGFINAVYGLDLKPKLTSNATINGKRYRVFDDITDEVLDGLASEDKIRIRAYYPVPGYIFGAGIAGQVSAKDPAQPLTNRAVPGISMLNRSNDYFSPSQLDTIASGGNWVLEQRSVGSVVNRHQMSTDAVTVEARELSITTQVDYAAKFLRDLVSPLIGTKVINDSFINQLEATMQGAALDLVENGNVRDLRVQKVYQDELEPDTIKADILLLPLYPLNYIKITLEF